MANLRAIENPLPYNNSISPSPRDRPLGSAEKIRHTEPVPGTTDNDSDSWRKRHSAEIALAEQDIDNIYGRTADLHTAADPSGWVAASNNQQGGIALKSGSRYTLANARALADNAFSVGPEGDWDNYDILVRVPAATNPQQVRVHLIYAAGLPTYNLVLNDMTNLGLSSDGNWEFYTWAHQLGNVLVAQLQVTANAAHVGTSRFDGRFDGEIIDGEVDEPVWKSRHKAQSDPLTEERLATLEDRTSEVSFDNHPGWAVVPDNNAGYGRFRFVGNGGDVDSYTGLDYDTMEQASGSEVVTPSAVTAAGVVWVLPNNITWSRVRLSVYRGGVKYRFTAQSMRNVPASLRSAIANFPSGTPDHTARWLASSDTNPHALGDLAVGDVIEFEFLADNFEPRWDGDLGDGIVTEDSLSAEVTAHINRHENAQGRVEISTDPDPVLVGSPTPVDEEESIPQDAALAHAIRIANLSGLHRALQVRMDIDFFLQRATQNRNTGRMNAVEVYIEITNKPRTRTRLVRQALTLANFLTQFDAAGADTYSGSADYTHNVNMNLDVSGWDIDEDDLVTLRVIAFGTAGSAHVRVVFRNTVIIYDELASSVRQVPEFPAAGSRAGKSLKFAGNQIGWHPTFQKAEELASRDALAGGWTIPTSTRFGARNAITQSGTALHIGAHSAMLSDTYGVIVDVEMSLGTMSTFIPWSAFHTGSGTYVTNGGHGGQGIPVGYWNADNDSELVATADWASDHGRFELTIAGRSPSGSATIRVWSAQ